MIIYKCIHTGDELFTDVYKPEKYKCFYKFKGKMVSRSNAVDESKLGSNPSAEEAAEGTDDAVASGINVALDNRLTETGFGSKKDYQTYFKGFIKLMEEHVKKTDPNRALDEFRASITEGFKEMAAEFKELVFYQGESMDPDGNIMLCKWDSDSEVTFYVFADGVIEEKV